MTYMNLKISWLHPESYMALTGNMDGGSVETKIQPLTITIQHYNAFKYKKPTPGVPTQMITCTL